MQPLAGDDDKSGMEVEDIKLELDDKSEMKKETSNSEDLFDKKRKWGRGIQIYKLVGGKFLPKEFDEDIKKQ